MERGQDFGGYKLNIVLEEAPLLRRSRASARLQDGRARCSFAPSGGLAETREDEDTNGPFLFFLGTQTFYLIDKIFFTIVAHWLSSECTS